MDENNESVNRLDKKRELKRKIIVLAVIAGLAILVIGVLWARKSIETFRRSKEYKQSYDIVQEQLNFCTNPRVQNNEDPAVIVHYCDQFKKRFKDVQLEKK